MDYQYIKQLLERYWEAETSQQEEEILKIFFSQEELPEDLAKYKGLFDYQRQQASIGLGEEFDKRMLSAIGEEEVERTSPFRVVKAARMGFTRKLRPLFRAAAAVAIVTLIGLAAQHSLQSAQEEPTVGWNYDRQAYKDSFDDPQKAYEAGIRALKIFKLGAQTAVSDTTRAPKAEQILSE